MDFDVMYKGMVIANIQGGSAEEALRNARAIYGPNVTVEES